MPGGFTYISGNKPISLRDKLHFILTEYKYKYNVYKVRKGTKLIVYVDIYANKPLFLLKELSGEIDELYQRIINVTGENVEINIKDA